VRLRAVVSAELVLALMFAGAAWIPAAAVTGSGTG